MVVVEAFRLNPLFSSPLIQNLNVTLFFAPSTVATYLGELQSRTSQNLGTVREHVEPFVHQASDTATKRLSDISSMLKSQAEGLGLQLESQAETLKTQMEVTAQELRTSLEGKLDELTELLSPYATKIREQFETIMDKVKESGTA